MHTCEAEYVHYHADAGCELTLLQVAVIFVFNKRV